MAIGLNFQGRSESYIRGYLEQAARYDKKNCTPGKTIQCGNVCRKPENCKQKSEDVTPKKQKAQTKKEQKPSSQITQTMEGYSEGTKSSPATSHFIDKDDDPLSVKLGQILRIPQKSIKTKKSGMSSQQIDAIASEMKKRGKNVTPVMIKRTGEDKYEVVSGGQIVEAARKAKLDFVWTVVVDDGMARQMDIEMGRI